ncbi:S41 family peptidase [Azospirillum halopraeferens]|uniref:S41 family peptidase n=1 Tax=Azospirillum halopraeferens TaxID=34010 RepID=UPI000410C3C4|nr:S41 family peptidase [Azospirillum halopraeferens]
MKVPYAAAIALCAFLALPVPAFAQPADEHAQAAPAQQSVRDSEREAVDLFIQALRSVRSSYVEPMSNRELAEIAIGAMAGRDKYSKYMNAADYQEMQQTTRGVFAGIGVRYAPDGNRYRIIEVIEGSPAEQAGLRHGDVILAVDRHSVSEQDQASVNRLIRGANGTSVTLTILRGDAANPMDLAVVRGTVTVPSVKHAAVGQVGYIRIGRFDRQTYPGVNKAIRELRAEIGPALRGFVIDVRNNPGGLVRASVDVADAFLEDGTILTSRGRDRAANRTYTATAGDETGGAPVVVLVNGRSASASEILTGALKDHGRATVIGSKTFGKGVIQSILPMKEGAAIKLTTARYFTPAGHSIHEVGIQPHEQIGPDTEANLDWQERPDAATDQPLARALAILNARGTLPPTTTAGAVPVAPAPATVAQTVGSAG